MIASSRDGNLRISLHAYNDAGDVEAVLAALERNRALWRSGCVPVDQQRRLDQAADQAHAAQERGDVWAAGDAWRRYILIEDALRNPQELLDEGVALSKVAIDLWLQR